MEDAKAEAMQTVEAAGWYYTGLGISAEYENEAPAACMAAQPEKRSRARRNKRGDYPCGFPAPLPHPAGRTSVPHQAAGAMPPCSSCRS